VLEAQRPADVGAEREPDVLVTSAIDVMPSSSLLVDEHQRTRGRATRALAQAVAPVLPVVAVAGLDERTSIPVAVSSGTIERFS
jgi:hypothetical protein